MLGWAAFHLWEQWSAFAGRERFVARMSGTSHGPLAIAVEIALGLLPIVVWLGLEARLVTLGPEPSELRGAMAEHPELARRLGSVVRVASWVLLCFLVVHAVWLWLPKLTEGSDPLRTWLRLRDELGTWPMAIVHALGLTALGLHVWAAPVRMGIVFDWLPTPESRRAARLSGAIVALMVLVLLAQLVGWHAAGAGTVWPM